MKKKLFLIFLILTMLTCIFALSVSAEGVTLSQDYDRTYTLDEVSYPLWEQDSEGNQHPLIWYLNGENEMRSVWADGQANEAGVYVSLGCWEGQLSKMTVYESNGKTYTSDLSFVIVNLNGVELTHKDELYPLEYVHAKAFHTNETIPSLTEAILNENAVLRAIFLPDTLKHIGWSQGITSTMAAFYSFNNCTALEYVEFHPGTVLDDNTLNRGAFVNCSSLKAISLPDSIKIFGNAALAGCSSLTAVYLPAALTTLSGAGNPFANSDNIYFVNEPFRMNSVNDIPSKPKMYYFPQGLTSFGATVLSPNANKAVVISKNVTFHSTKMYAGSGVEAAVYLGNMTSLSLTKEQSTALNIFMPNTTALPTVTATGSTSGSAVYLCKLNKSFVFDQSSWKDETVHVEDPSKSVITKEPNCVDNAWGNIYCFCGEYIGEIEIENSNDGEKHDLENAIVINIVYDDFASTGTKMLKCPKCNAEGITEGEVPALFTCNGYSAPENGDGGIAVDYSVNLETIAEYERLTGETVSYGIYAATQSGLGDKDIFDENGEVVGGALTVALTKRYTKVSIKLVGFNTDALKATKFTLGAYVEVVGTEGKKISYLQSGEVADGDKYAFVSFNDVVNNALSK